MYSGYFIMILWYVRVKALLLVCSGVAVELSKQKSDFGLESL